MTTVGTILSNDFAKIATSTVGVLSNSQAGLQLPPVSQVQSELDTLHDIKIGHVLLAALEGSVRLN
jgi:hypothetical protein